MTDTTPTPQDRLHIAQSVDGGHPIVVLDGEVDPHTAPMLQDHIDAILDADSHDALVLDFAAVTFVDSAGLRVIADTHRRLDAAGGALTLRSPSGGLQKLLTVTGLGDHITVE